MDGWVVRGALEGIDHVIPAPLASSQPLGITPEQG